MTGLYVHIPFCVSKCYYCDFNSYDSQLHQANDYCDALQKEAYFYKGTSLDTVYIGGGTPTCLEPSLLLGILDAMKRNFSLRSPEITVEANPATVDLPFLRALHEAGVNRLSLGVQSFDGSLLRTLGRLHEPADAVDAVYLAREAGFSNIGIDLMYSLPGQTMDMVRSDLARAVTLPIRHVSYYGLKVEKGTPFYEQGITPADEELDRQMYHFCSDYLKSFGFCHYEISNFALPGFYSRHNMKYWSSKAYIGLGAGAHSCYGEKRYANVKSIDTYMAMLRDGQRPIEESYTLTDKDINEEKIMLGLRLDKGIPVAWVGAKKDLLQKYVQMGYMKQKRGRVSLTSLGFDVSNSIIASFL